MIYFCVICRHISLSFYECVPITSEYSDALIFRLGMGSSIFPIGWGRVKCASVKEHLRQISSSLGNL